MDALFDRLRQVSHFKDLPDSGIEAIVKAGQVLTHEPGNTLFDEGAACAGMFVLLSGLVHLYKTSPQGRQSLLAEIRPVIMFNEVAVIDGDANPVTAKAVERCRTWQVSCERFQVLLNNFPQVGSGLLRVMAARNRLLIALHEDLASRTVDGRLARTLLELSRNGECIIDRYQHTNLELAARTSTVPEAVSRGLRWLKSQEWIETNRKSIRVTNPQHLASLADQFSRTFR